MATHREIRLRKAAIAQALEDGKSLSEIRSDFEVEDSYIKQCLNSVGLVRFNEMRKEERQINRGLKSEGIPVGRNQSRDEKIIALAASGETLAAIGKQFSLSRQRVQQVLANNEIQISDIKRSIAVEHELLMASQVAEVGALIQSCPGITMDEIRIRLPNLADKLDDLVQTHQVLVLANNVRAAQAHTSERRRAIDSLRLAAKIRTPLTGGAYAQLILSGQIDGYSRPRIVQLFGSWNLACEEAGVIPGQSNRKSEYVRRHSYEEILDIIGEFLVDEHRQGKRGSIYSYDEWRAKLKPNRVLPSSGTIRLQVSASWDFAKDLALLRLRGSWGATEIKSAGGVN